MASVAEANGKFRSSLGETFETDLMQRLLARKEPLIDLAIASYCDNADILEALWRSGDKTIKIAIATNTFKRGFIGLPATDFEEACSDPVLVRAVFENPSMAHGGLANFLERSENFKSLSDEGWLSGLYYALRNPVLRSVPEEDRFSDDGYLDYSRRRPFGAAWKLLILLEATDRHAAILSDAFLNIAVFSPPYEEMLKARGKLKVQGSVADLSPERLAEFSERYERGTRLYLDYVFHKWRDTEPLSDEEDDKWPKNRGFIRQGVAAGAAREGYRKNVVAYLRDHPDKWVRAGYYTTFEFADEKNVRSAYDKDGAFFTEHGVYNKALYRNTPVGRSFRVLVDKKSENEWKDFSDDQMRRSIDDHWAMRLWKENPLVYPHPEDDLDALEPLPFKREKDESVLEFMERRADALKDQNDARLAQISTWLKDAPQEPQRVLPLIGKLVASLHSEVQMCVTTLETAFEDTAAKRRLALAELAAELKQTKHLVIIAAIAIAVMFYLFRH
jgi:hypothetical protein